MNELRPVSGQPYAAVADADAEKDLFYQTHAASYKEYDFVSPFLALMRKARGLSHLSAQEKREWVLSMHKEMIERAGYDEVEKQMALGSAMPLTDVLLNISSGHSIFIRDSFSFYRYIHHDESYQIDVPYLIQTALEAVKEEIGQRSAVHLLEIFRDTCFMYLRKYTVEELSSMALKEINWTPQEKGQFEKLLPFLLKGFESAERVNFRFSDPEERTQTGCCCIFL